ncbi:MAG TPA: circadian clock KaiB family protein [Lacibacter sp.]|jgi:circadian clock protein KaiB|nr:circadian clock KaiB family protein [Lacibacter sp.]
MPNKKKKIDIVAEGRLVLQLYVSGMSPKSMAAIENINRICQEHLEGAFDLEIVDIYKDPQAAADHQIVFSPALIKRFPNPKKILVGSLSDESKVVKALGIEVKK